MARVNYQRDKRQRDLARQQKQEQKRQRRLNKDHDGTTAVDAEPGTETTEAPDAAEPGAAEEP